MKEAIGEIFLHICEVIIGVAIYNLLDMLINLWLATP